MYIQHAYTGWPGCTHDARVLRNSDLYQNAERFFMPNKFIIGDSAYPLCDWLITVFRDNGHLTHAQRRFNYKLSSLRQTVERTIGHLKGRFRRLREVPLHNLRSICQLIMAGCVLHNLCIIGNDEIQDFINNDPEEALHPNNYVRIHRNTPTGVQHRNRLLEYVEEQL